MKEKKSLIIALAVIIVIIAIAGVIFVLQKKIKAPVSQKQDGNKVVDIANLNTYKNDKYGFEIKFPSTWVSIENAGDNSDKSVVSFVSPETQQLVQAKKSPAICDLSIYYYDSVAQEPENLNNKFNAKTIDDLIDKDDLITKIGSTKLGGKDATDVIRGGNGAYYTVLAENNGHLYEVYFCNKSSKESLTETDKNILSSFVFLK